MYSTCWGVWGNPREPRGKIRDGARALWEVRLFLFSGRGPFFKKNFLWKLETLGAFQGYKKPVCALTRLKIKDPHPGAFGVGRRHCVGKAGQGLLCDLRQVSALSGLRSPIALDWTISKRPVEWMGIFIQLLILLTEVVNRESGLWHGLEAGALWRFWLPPCLVSPVGRGRFSAPEKERQLLLFKGAP